MNDPVPAIDAAKTTLVPFLDPDVTEKLFKVVEEHLHDMFDGGDGVDETCVLPILTDVVEGVREHWQEKQLKVQASATGVRLCTASANVTMITPGVLQISMACQGPHQHLEAEMVSKAISSIRKAVKEYKHADSSS